MFQQNIHPCEQAGQERANSFYNWFRTVKGQKTVGGFWIGLSALGALYHLAPHWFFMNQVKSIYQSYNKGFKTPVRNELLKLLNEVVNDMGLSDEEVDHLSVFIGNMTEPYGWGELGKESLIGIPDHFHFTTVEDVPMERMRIGESHGSGDENILLTGSQIESEPGQMFANALVMTDKAKKFALAREVERTRLVPYMTHSVFSFSFILLLYNAARIVNKRAGLMGRPPLFRGVMYLSILPTFIFTYLLVKDTYTRRVDKVSCHTSCHTSCHSCHQGAGPGGRVPGSRVLRWRSGVLHQDPGEQHGAEGAAGGGGKGEVQQTWRHHPGGGGNQGYI